MFISGIGCSSRFPYYMNTFGMHSIHGRAPAIATGLSTSRPDLSVWVVTGDGDALSIGGNHLIHALRRNVNSEDPAVQQPDLRFDEGAVFPRVRAGQDHQVFADGLDRRAVQPGVSGTRRRGDSFVARTLDSDRKHLQSVLRAAAEHEGTALVEIYQNCNIFNDGAFEILKDAETRDDWTIRMQHGEPLRFGSDGSKAVVRDSFGALSIADDVPGDAETLPDGRRVVVHDAHRDDPSYAFALSRLSSSTEGGVGAYAPMGVFRDVVRPVYDTMMSEQLDAAAAKSPGDDAALQKLLLGSDPWTID